MGFCRSGDPASPLLVPLLSHLVSVGPPEGSASSSLTPPSAFISEAPPDRPLPVPPAVNPHRKWVAAGPLARRRSIAQQAGSLFSYDDDSTAAETPPPPPERRLHLWVPENEAGLSCGVGP
ncbi:hypothetical protein OJAV_G00145300 [Oryzias javanicus]|uniref:Uncharacterized protein n=1 Tax=Oryzias javanicus TaxID=123683 RepID=A0A3S2U748_ORYJA|nr:hypothetical protein OJAV_G00145300 [Oryzias javanicus]